MPGGWLCKHPPRRGADLAGTPPATSLKKIVHVAIIPMMELTVNGQSRQLPDGATIADLLADLGKAHTPAAVEVNRQVVPRRHHAEHVLNPADQVEVVTLVGGG